MKRLMLLIKDLKSKWFPTEEDTKWKNWVDFKSRETRDLVDLLSQEVDNSFKKRALFLLFVPSAEFNFLYWKGDVGKFFYCKSKILDKLTPELLNYAVELIMQFITALSPMHCDRPRHVAGGGGGIMVYMSIPDKYHDALHFYNRCILKLLEKPAANQAEKIFVLYSLNDISTFCGMEDSSGYNPFEDLMCSDEIDEKWKLLADRKMQEIVLAEIAGKARPREDWENALKCYSSFIQMQLSSHRQRYSKELLTEQARFLVENLQPNMHLIDNWNVILFFNLLSEECQKELRRKIARHIVIENTNKFSVFNEDAGRAAKQMLTEFEDDQELIKKVRKLINEEEIRRAKDANRQVEEKEAEGKIIAAMK